MTKEISVLITTLRLPLMICVVFIHSELKEPTSSVVLSFAQSWFSRILPTVAVPLFFFFSGYLFFVGINREGRNRLNLNILLNKLKKRFRTLLIPYLIWNTIVILAFGFLHRFLPSLCLVPEALPHLYRPPGMP